MAKRPPKLRVQCLFAAGRAMAFLGAALGLSAGPSCADRVEVAAPPAEAGSGGASGDAGDASGGTGGMTTGTGAGGAATCHELACMDDMFVDCGDCEDNDGDGLVDMADPECVSPCDNSEGSLGLNQPGVDPGDPCRQECHFDWGLSPYDDCFWDYRCDPLEVPPDYYPLMLYGEFCAYDPDAIVGGTLSTCAELSAAQSPTCLDSCLPVTPNGCDCFGCCELPAGSGQRIWLSSTDPNATEACTSAAFLDPTTCHPCTPVPSCDNPCESCELCLGKPSLPPSCGDEQLCPPGAQRCGLDGQPACPGGGYCLTGCCTTMPTL